MFFCRSWRGIVAARKRKVLSNRCHNRWQRNVYISFFMPLHKNSFFNLATQGRRRAAITLWWTLVLLLSQIIFLKRSNPSFKHLISLFSIRAQTAKSASKGPMLKIQKAPLFEFIIENGEGKMHERCMGCIGFRWLWVLFRGTPHFASQSDHKVVRPVVSSKRITMSKRGELGFLKFLATIKP